MQPKPLPCTTKRERACVISSPSIIHHFAISVQTHTDETLRKHCNIPQGTNTTHNALVTSLSSLHKRYYPPLSVNNDSLFLLHCKDVTERTNSTNASLGSQPRIPAFDHANHQIKANDTLHHYRSWSLHPSTRNRSRGPENSHLSRHSIKKHVSTLQKLLN